MMFKTVLAIFSIILTIGSVLGQKGGYRSDRFIQQQQYNNYYPGKTSSPYISQSPMGQYRQYPYAPPLSPIEQRRAQLLMRNMGGFGSIGGMGGMGGYGGGIGGYDDDYRYNSQNTLDNYGEKRF